MFRVTVAIEVGGRRIRYFKPMGWFAFWRQVLRRSWDGAWRMVIDRTPAAVARDAILGLLAVAGLFLLRDQLVARGIMSGDNPLDTFIGLIAIGLLIVALFATLFVGHALFIAPYQMWKERSGGRPPDASSALVSDSAEAAASKQQLELLRADMLLAFSALSICLLAANRLAGRAWPDYPLHHLAKDACDTLYEKQALTGMRARLLSADWAASEIISELRALMHRYRTLLMRLATICDELPPTVVFARDNDEIASNLPKMLRALRAKHDTLGDRYVTLARLRGFSGLIGDEPPEYWLLAPAWPSWAEGDGP